MCRFANAETLVAELQNCYWGRVGKHSPRIVLEYGSIYASMMPSQCGTKRTYLLILIFLLQLPKVK